MEYYSAIKKNTFESVLMRWMKLEPIIQSEVSQKEKQPLWRTVSIVLCTIARSSAYRRRQWHPTPVLLPGKSHGQRSLVGYSPWGRTESDTTEVSQQHVKPSVETVVLKCYLI